ncbi:MAG TPA: hypothetical protein VFV50_14725 [Bdellovibrionales bacterium]|nr:hypothetical protein [Bdellovibrionales bacterium]
MNELKRIALITAEDWPELSEDDRLLKAHLETEGFAVETPVWSDPSVEWDAFGALVMRSIWDYHKRFDEFAAWLEDIEAEARRIYNPLSVVRWNASKAYLLELETQGCPIVPTHLARQGQGLELAHIMDANGWSEAVVKPAISASALRTKRVPRAEAAAFQSVFERWLAGGELLVQPFISQIATEGEWSLLYFGSGFSHSVLKTPKAGDFRVQSEYGGSTRAQPAPAAFRKLGDDLNQWLFEKFGTPLLFARIDLLSIDGKPALGELELIEPYLFFGSEPESIGRFTRELRRLLDNPPRG